MSKWTLIKNEPADNCMAFDPESEEYGKREHERILTYQNEEGRCCDYYIYQEKDTDGTLKVPVCYNMDMDCSYDPKDEKHEDCIRLTVEEQEYLEEEVLTKFALCYGYAPDALKESLEEERDI